MSKLFIRSQDKKRIMKANDISIEEVVSSNPNNPNSYQQEKVESYRILVNGFNFGNYKTKEKAFDILNSIQNHLSGKLLFVPKKEKEDDLIKPKAKQVEYTSLNCDCFFQMPLD